MIFFPWITNHKFSLNTHTRECRTKMQIDVCIQMKSGKISNRNILTIAHFPRNKCICRHLCWGVIFCSLSQSSFFIARINGDEIIMLNIRFIPFSNVICTSKWIRMMNSPTPKIISSILVVVAQIIASVAQQSDGIISLGFSMKIWISDKSLSSQCICQRAIAVLTQTNSRIWWAFTLNFR